jgi:hypothetical protein
MGHIWDDILTERDQAVIKKGGVGEESRLA